MLPELDRDYFFGVIAWVKPGLITRLLQANFDRKMARNETALTQFNKPDDKGVYNILSKFGNGFKKSRKGAGLIEKFLKEPVDPKNNMDVEKGGKKGEADAVSTSSGGKISLIRSSKCIGYCRCDVESLRW